MEDRDLNKHIKLEVQIQIEPQYSYGTDDWDIFPLDILENYNRIFLTKFMILSFIAIFVKWLKAIVLLIYRV